jgi:hypothetical protein
MIIAKQYKSVLIIIPCMNVYVEMECMLACNVSASFELVFFPYILVIVAVINLKAYIGGTMLKHMTLNSYCWKL